MGTAPVPVRGPGGGGRRWVILVACAVLGSAIGVVGAQLNTPDATPTVAATPTPTPTAVIAATVTPVSPKDSSFTKRDGAWRTSTYSDVNFGNLKSGVGLLLDLKTARPLTSVTFTAETGPMTVELRAGDAPATDGAKLTLVGKAVQANGSTTLPATTGGSHRYWMIWVTKLPASTLRAQITADPVARG